MDPFEARHLLKAMKDDGWYLGDTEGACRQYIHKKRDEVVTVCVRYTDELGERTRGSATEPRVVDPDVEATVVLEPTRTGFSAHAPELPGCVATGETEEETRDRMSGALELHRACLRERIGKG